MDGPRTTILVGTGLVAGGVAWWWLYGRHDEPGGVLGDLNQILAALTSIGRGSRLTRDPYDTTTGLVEGSPAELAAAANLDVETYSLARAVASEEGRSSELIKIAVAHAITNHARKAGRSITAVVTGARNPAHQGSYGTQKDIDPGELDDEGKPTNPNEGKSDRYVSTALDPYAQEGQIAAGVIDGSIPDPTGGADQFDRPAGEKDPDRIAQNRIDAGAELVEVSGIDGNAIRFWRTG
jgi:hypothetical protein